ncbi:hypothetical protein C4568_02860 [Candidatus Parcubacteria bacterium]|nr:MAG: hypothetical protein C4568_02860 [Candidatus Parcubacteria bacterium]
MNKTLQIFFVLIIAVGLYAGVRFIGSAIHYGCHPDRIVNIEDGDDCAPPFVGVGEMSFYVTGGPLVPFFNRDATTVRRVSWDIETTNAEMNEQKIGANVTTYDGKTVAYDLGTAHGCTGTATSELHDHTIVIGKVECYYALSSTSFSAFKHGKGFSIERYDESAEDGSIATTTLVEI